MDHPSKIYIHVSIISGSYTLFIDEAKNWIKSLANKECEFMLYGPAFWSGKLVDELATFCNQNNISSMIVGNTSTVLLNTVDNFVLLMDSYENLHYPYQKYRTYANDEKIRIIKMNGVKNAV